MRPVSSIKLICHFFSATKSDSLPAFLQDARPRQLRSHNNKISSLPRTNFWHATRSQFLLSENVAGCHSSFVEICSIRNIERVLASSRPERNFSPSKLMHPAINQISSSVIATLLERSNASGCSLCFSSSRGL